MVKPMEIINDRHQDYNPYQASCSTCSRRFDSIDFTCQAFPSEIPDGILTGDNKHEVPVKGQVNDLVYSPSK
jgi:hypothetical protein